MRFLLNTGAVLLIAGSMSCVKRDYNSSAKEHLSPSDAPVPKAPEPIVARIATGGLSENQSRAKYDYSVGVKTYPATECGLTGSIDDRIADCLNKNPNDAKKTDKTSPKNASWSLVVRTSWPKTMVSTSTKTDEKLAAVEVWRDNLTGLIWSDAIGGADGKNNWCHASGSNNKKGSPHAEDDPFDLCDNEKYQSQSAPISLCVEDKENLNGTLKSDPAKGGLGLLDGATTPVKWWLPDLEEFKTAFSHGAKYVLPHIAERWEWSASVFSWQRVGAWVFSGTGGFVSPTDSRHFLGGVRCVGMSLK